MRPKGELRLAPPNVGRPATPLERMPPADAPPTRARAARRAAWFLMVATIRVAEYALRAHVLCLKWQKREVFSFRGAITYERNPPFKAKIPTTRTKRQDGENSTGAMAAAAASSGPSSNNFGPHRSL